MKKARFLTVRTIAGLAILLAFWIPSAQAQSSDGVGPETLVPAAGVSQTITFPDRAPFPSTRASRGAVLRTERIAQVITVTTTNDTGDGSLRKAILDADANPGTDIIAFNIPGPGVHTISPILKLPNITETVLIDATTQPGYIGTPLIEIDGSNLGAYDIFDVFADASVIRGFAFNRVPTGTAIVIWSGNGNTIAGNLFGMDPSGLTPLAIAYNGVILFTAGNVVGGIEASNRNVFAATGNPAAAISGASARGNIIRGNYFGTDISGIRKLGTRQESVLIINGASGNTVGGNVPGARNVMSGSTTGSGISIVNSGPGRNTIQGNFIGTDVNGINPMGNAGNGVFVTHTDSVLIGGSGQGEGNVIGGNASPGIFVDSSARFTSIVGNSIGVSSNGVSAVPNSKGIVVNGSPGNRIEGNIISGNTLHGVEIRNSGASGNILVGNLIGVSALMGILVGNDGHGVLINASDNVIGGTNEGEANIIAGNFGAGVSIGSGRRNTLSRNAIYSNFGLGIDLAPGGVNPNDTLDVDTGANDMQNYPVLDSLKRRGSSTDVYGHLVTAPNGLYTVEFFADSGDISHYGQGHRYLGSFTTPTGQSGTARFFVSLPGGVSSREVVTTTATDADGNTSEFSRGIGRDYKITNPPRGKLWVVGEMDTIRWDVADTGHVRIEFSSDSGFTYHTIAADTSGAAREFPWTVEKVRSTRCRIRVSSVDDPSLTGESEYFKVKGVELTRYTADSSYEAFDPAVHGWNFRNDPSVMWSAVWYNQFNYANGIDPVTMQQYPAAWNAPPINAKSSDFPDWQLFTSAFGVGQCYFSSPTGMNYQRSAVDFWSAMKGGWGGSCYGFAVSSLMAFDAPVTFLINEPEMPPFVNLFPLVTGPAHHLQNTVSKLWVYTVGRINKIQSDTHASDHLSDVLDALREDYLGDTRDDRIISFWASGGHSLAPYRIEKDSAQPNIRYLYLYDSNIPGASDKRVVMDIVNDTWTYAPLGWANTLHFVISKPVSTNFPPAQIPKAGLPIQSRPFAVSGLKGQIELYSPAGTSVSITSNSGGRIRYADVVTVDSIPGAHIIVPPTGGPHPPIGCSLPLGTYAVELAQFPDTTARLFLFADSTIYCYYHKTATLNHRDLILYDGGITYTTADTGTREIGLHSLLVQQERERGFDISGLAMNDRDTVRVQIGGDATLSLTSRGAGHAYDLVLTNGSNHGSTVFAHKQIPILANSTHRVVPDWTDLTNRLVKILIDHGNHGSFTDSLLLNNQLTDVGQGGNGELKPVEFALLQNYPNPFNPSTVIEYSLPDRQSVSIVIYNVLGQRIASLVNEVEGPGRYTVTWKPDGSVATGVYFYRIHAGTYVATKKMLLMR